MSSIKLNRKPIEVLTDKSIQRDKFGRITTNPDIQIGANGEVIEHKVCLWVNEERTMFDFNDLAKGLFSYLTSADGVHNDRWRTYFVRSGIIEHRKDLYDLTSKPGKRLVSINMFESLTFSMAGLGGQMYLDGYTNWQHYLRKGHNYVIQPGQHNGSYIVKVGKYDDNRRNARLSVYCNKEKAAGQQIKFVNVFCDAEVNDTSEGEKLLKEEFGIIDEAYYEETKKIRYHNAVDGDNELFDMYHFDDCPDIIFNEEDGSFDNSEFLEWVHNKFVKALDKIIADKDNVELCYQDESVYVAKSKKQ